MNQEPNQMLVNLEPGSYSGFVLDSIDNNIVVSKVDPGSPAEKIGIVEGLKVLSVNDKSIENWTLSQVQKVIEKATVPLKILLKKYNIETDKTQSSSQRSSKNFGTDDEGSQSTGSQSSIINIKSTSSINPLSINIYSKSNLSFNQSITTLQHPNNKQSDVTNLSTELKTSPKIDSKASEINSSQIKLTGENKFVSSDQDMKKTMNDNNINSNSFYITQQNNVINSLNQNTTAYMAAVVQSNPGQNQVQYNTELGQTKNAENSPNNHSKTIIVSKPGNPNATTVKHVNKTVTYTPDTAPGDFETSINKLPINMCMNSSSHNSEIVNVSEITSSYWPAGTLITVEQQMELEKRQKIQNELLYSKVIPKNKSAEKINADKKCNLQSLKNSNSNNNAETLKKESIYNEIKISPEASPKLNIHDLTQVSSDVTNDAKIVVESALNENGRRRSRSVPISEINLDKNKDVNVPLSRKSSSVDRKSLNHSSFGKSFFSRIFGSQKKRKEQKPNKIIDDLKNSKDSSYDTLVNVDSDKKSNSEKYEIIKHAETYLVVERSKKVNKLQSRDSMNSIDEGTSCMPACVCLNPKSKHNSNYRIANKSPEFKRIDNSQDIQPTNDYEKCNLKVNCVSSTELVESKQDTVATINSNIIEDIGIACETNNCGSTQIIVENALKEQGVTKDNVTDNSINPNANLANSNSIKNSANIHAPNFKSDAIISVDNSNLKLSSEKSLGSNLIIEKAVADGFEVKNEGVSYNLSINSKVANDKIDAFLESCDISTSEIVQKNTISEKKLSYKPAISPKPLFFNITKDASKFKVEIPEKEIKINNNTILNLNDQVKTLPLSLEKKEITASAFESQNSNANNIYDNAGSNVSSKKIHFETKKEADYDTIDIKNDTNYKLDENNKYTIQNLNANNSHLNSYTLPSFKNTNEVSLNQNKMTSLSNLNERNLSQFPIYDIPSLITENKMSTNNDIKLQNTSNFYSNLKSNYFNKENINQSAFTQNQFDTNHSIGFNSKTIEINKSRVNEDEVFDNVTENIYEMIQLTPEIIRKENSNFSLLEKKAFKNDQKPSVKPLKKLNDLVLPVYTRVNPHLSHEVVKPEPIKPSHLNLNKINYSNFEKREPHKNLDTILNELHSPQNNNSSNPPKNNNSLQSFSKDNINYNKTTHNDHYDNTQNISLKNFSNETIKETNDLNLNINYFNKNIPKNITNIAQVTNEQNNSNIYSYNELNNINSKEFNSPQSSYNSKLNNVIDKNFKSDSSNLISNYTESNNLPIRINNNSYNLLQFDSQKKIDINSDINNKAFDTNIVINQDNISKENNNRSKNHLNNIKEFEHLDTRCSNINNSFVNTNLDLEKQNWRNDLNLEKHLNNPNLFNGKGATNFKELSIANSSIPDVVVNGPSPYSTLNTKVAENESMDEKQKRKIEIERILAVDRQRKIAQQQTENESRRHSDNFSPLDKASVILNRYEKDFCMSYPNIPEKTRLTKYRGKAKVLYNFRAQRPRELSLRKGDIVYITNLVDENWYRGEHHGHQGIFPIIYVEVIETLDSVLSKAVMREGVAEVLYDFNAHSSLELSIEKGTKVTLIRRVDSNWYEGKWMGKQGIFPSTYVDVHKEPMTPVCTPACTPLASRNITPLPGWMSPTPSILSGAPSIPSAPTSPISFLNSPSMLSPMGRSMASPLNFSPTRYGSRPPSECSGRDSMTPSFYKQYNVDRDTHRMGIPKYEQSHLEVDIGDSSGYKTTNRNIQYLRAEKDHMPHPNQSDASKYSSLNTQQLYSTKQDYVQQRSATFSNFDESNNTKYSNLNNNLAYDMNIIMDQTKGRRLSKESRSSNSSLSEKGILINQQESIYDISPSHKAKPAKQVTFPDLNHKAQREYERYLVLFDFKARDKDELELRRGEIVRVLEKCSDGWYVGMKEATGLIGSFPGNYVKIIKYNPPTTIINKS